MFDNVVVAVDDYEAGRDAIELAKILVSGDGDLALIYVEVAQPKPAPDSGAVRDAAVQRFALERLRALAEEANVVAQVSCIEARSVRRGLHEFVASRDRDLLVIGASRRDKVGRILLGDDAREVLEDAPCAVAVAPAGYSARTPSVPRPRSAPR